MQNLPGQTHRLCRLSPLFPVLGSRHHLVKAVAAPHRVRLLHVQTVRRVLPRLRRSVRACTNLAAFVLETQREGERESEKESERDGKKKKRVDVNIIPECTMRVWTQRERKL